MIAQRQPAPPRIVTDMSPGDYLRLRRKAAGLSVEQVAHRICVVPTSLSYRILSLEAGLVIAGDGDLAILANIFPLEPEIYRDLAAGLPVSLCADCAASWTDACGLTDPACAWHLS